MDERQARALGKLLQQRRKALGYSTHELAQAAAVSHSTVVRFEQGRFSAPRPDKLARFAQLLDLPLADLYARAGYLVPGDLPSFDLYLQAKYPALPTAAVAELHRHLTHLAQAAGFPLDISPQQSTDTKEQRPAA